MSQHRIGIARNQFQFSCLEDLIAEDNAVRVIDAFVDILDFKALGFAHLQPKKTGNPPYHPAMMLRIYLYGYLNRVRSSRKLEAECGRNIEMQWLCNYQIPCYHTIATFRSYKETVIDKKTNTTTTFNHPKSLKEVFRSFNRFLNGEELFGKETIATDGSKMRAQNSKKKNYSLDKLDKKIAMSDANIDKYMSELDSFDQIETLDDNQALLQSDAKTKLEELKTWKNTFVELKTELLNRQEADPDVTQISITDRDARSIVINNSGHAEVSFNVVTAVDEKHKLIAHFFTDNIKDTTLLAESLIATKAELDNSFDPNLHKNTEGGYVENLDLSQKLNAKTTINGLADKGFHAATQIHQCTEAGIVTYVSVPNYTHPTKDKDFTIDNFVYDADNDHFTCPNNEILTTNGNWSDRKDRRGQFVQRVKRYNMSPKTCANCPFSAKCLSKTAIKNKVSRILERGECQQASTDNKKRLETYAGKLMYKKRQGIVEHPFGIIKRQWDCSYTLLRGLEKVNGEFAIVFTCYNLRRAMTIFGVKTLLDKLKAVKSACYTLFYTLFIAICSKPVKMNAKSLFLIKCA